MRPDYVYILTEEDGDPSLVKIGHGKDPLHRYKGYQAGNYRRLIVLFTLVGGQPLESELHKQFKENRVYRGGGDEWYKLTSDSIDFILQKVKNVLTHDAVLAYIKRVFDGPIRIPTVELGEAKAAPVRPVTRVGSVQPYSISEAEPPKSPYSKVGQKREK